RDYRLDVEGVVERLADANVIERRLGDVEDDEEHARGAYRLHVDVVVALELGDEHVRHGVDQVDFAGDLRGDAAGRFRDGAQDQTVNLGAALPVVVEGLE